MSNKNVTPVMYLVSYHSEKTHRWETLAYRTLERATASAQAMASRNPGLMVYVAPTKAAYTSEPGTPSVVHMIN